MKVKALGKPSLEEGHIPHGFGSISYPEYELIFTSWVDKTDREIADLLGVNNRTIRTIRAGKSWKQYSKRLKEKYPNLANTL